MDPDRHDALLHAGKVSREARERAVELVHEGGLLRALAEEVEGLMARRGLQPAFPTCISIDQVAAHYSPTHDDDLRFRRGNVVKLDLGAQQEGWIADTAQTVEVGTRNWTALIRASELALQTAVEAVHSVERYLLHAGKSVPNIAHGHDVLEEGEVVAIEPFASSGAGEVDGRRTGNIYRVVRTKPTKQPELNDFLALLSREFKTLPFAERWAFRLESRTPTLLNSLLRTGAVMSYPALLDLGNGIVSQTEHTMIVGSGGAEVTTA